MDTHPQPPPSTPTKNVHSFEVDSLLWWKQRGVWMVAFVFLVGALLFHQSRSTGCRKNPDQTAAINNARQIGLALFEFDNEYGKYPDVTTIAAVQSAKGSRLPLETKTSNDYFRQLIAADIIQSESMFYARVKGCKKSGGLGVKDDLAKGECGFSYLAGQSSKGNPSRPLLVTPLIPGTDRFDPKPFDGRAIILRMDNSVTSMNIDKHGHVIANGMNLLDPANPIWCSDKFTIVWPDL